MFLHVSFFLFQEKASHACKSIFLGPGWNWTTQWHMQQPTWLRGIFVQFLGGSWAGCLEGLRNFWEEQLTTAQDYTISRLNSPTRRNCVIFPVNNDRQIYAILDPNRLPDRIAQFLEGRLVSLQNCAISWGSYSACNWIKSGETTYEGDATSFDGQAVILQENHWSLCTWQDKTCCSERLVRKLQNEAKEKFWRVVVAATTRGDTLL